MEAEKSVAKQRLDKRSRGDKFLLHSPLLGNVYNTQNNRRSIARQRRGKQAFLIKRDVFCMGSVPKNYKRLSRPQGHNAAGRIKVNWKIQWPPRESNRDLPACSTVPQPTTLPRAPHILKYNRSMRRILSAVHAGFGLLSWGRKCFFPGMRMPSSR
jgi:hypothetical protein